jgi:hypothetical protein
VNNGLDTLLSNVALNDVESEMLDGYTPKRIDNELSYSRELTVLETGDHKFKYSFNPQEYLTPVCAGVTPAPCYDCIYDLEISIKEIFCGAEQFDADPNTAGKLLLKRTIGGDSDIVNATCAGNTAWSFSTDALLGSAASANGGFITVNLAPGTYQVKKKLSLNKHAFKQYEKLFLANNLCKTQDEFIAEAYSQLDTGGCEMTCEKCEELMEEMGSKEDFINAKVTEYAAMGIDTIGHTIGWVEYYDASVESCNSICGNSKSQCEIYLDIMKLDMMPGGQYAAFTYSSTGNVVLPTSGLPGYVNGFNILDDSYGSWSYASMPPDYKVVVNGTEQEVHTLSVTDFVKYWDDSWASYFVTFHPEYCQYTFCTANQATFDYQQDMMEAETFDEAESKGYLVYNSNTDEWEIGGDPLLTTLSGKYNEYVHLTATNTDDLGIVSMGTLALSQVFCNNQMSSLSEFEDCIRAARENFDNCGPYKDLYWTYLRAFYLSEHMQYMDSHKPDCGEIPEGATRRLISSTNSGLFGETAPTQASVAADIITNCATQCESYREIWAENLKGCALTQTELNQVLDALVDVCKQGCDEIYPVGASSVAPYNVATSLYLSFEEVMKKLPKAGFTNKRDIYSKTCSDLLIRFPQPYGSDYFAKSSAYADTCGCDVPEDCPCAEGENAAMSSTEKLVKMLRDSVPENEKCANCINCSDYAMAFNEFYTKNPWFLGYSYSDEKALATYFNQNFGFNLSFAEYRSQAVRCLGYDSLTVNDTTNIFAEYMASYIAPAHKGLYELQLVTYNSGSSKQFDYRYQFNNDVPVFVQEYIEYTGEILYATTDNSLWLSSHASSRVSDLVESSRAVALREIGVSSMTDISSEGLAGSQSTQFSHASPRVSDLVESSTVSEGITGTQSLTGHMAIAKTMDGPIVSYTDNRYLIYTTCLCSKLIQNPSLKTSLVNGADLPHPPLADFQNAVLDRCKKLEDALKAAQELEQESEKYKEFENFVWADFYKIQDESPLLPTAGSIAAIGCGIPGGEGTQTDSGSIFYKPEFDNMICEKVMPKFEEYYALNIKPDFETASPHYIDSVSLKDYLKRPAQAVLVKNLVIYLNSLIAGTAQDLPSVANLSDSVNAIWNLFSTCKQSACEYFLTTATTFDNTNYASYPGQNLHEYVTQNPNAPVSISFKALLNESLNKPPFLIFFGQDQLDKHFIGCTQGPCKVVTDLIATMDANSQYDTLFNDPHKTFSQKLREPAAAAILGTMLSTANATLISAPYFKRLTNATLIAAIEACWSCSGTSRDSSAIVNTLAELYKPYTVGATPASNNLLNSYYWQISTHAYPIVANALKKNIYKDVMKYLVHDVAYDQSYYHARTVDAAGLPFYVKIHTVNYTVTSPVNKWNYVLAKPMSGFRFAKVTNMAVKYITKISHLETEMLVELTWTGSVPKQWALVIVPSYPFYKDLMANQGCHYYSELCNTPISEYTVVVEEDPCIKRIKIMAQLNGEKNYREYVDSMRNVFETGYRQKCLDRVPVGETFTIKRKERQYHYTLYYYDQGGNLVKTVPPAGVVQLSDATAAGIDAKRIANQVQTTPAHLKTTLYTYNTLNQLIWQQTPDAGEAQFYYDAVGRLVASQNEKQKPSYSFSYTLFDNLGRITQVGQIQKTGPTIITHTIARDPAQLLTWQGTGTARRLPAPIMMSKPLPSPRSRTTSGDGWYQALTIRFTTLIRICTNMPHTIPTIYRAM